MVGQSDPVSGLPNQGQPTSPTGLSSPAGLAVTAGGLLVADPVNNRVVLFDPVPATSGAPAQSAIGQPNPFASSSALTRTGLNGPYGVAVGVVAGAPRMAVADSAANRVLIYAQVPASGTPVPDPVVVIGQPHFESGVQGCAGGLSFPTAVTITPQGKLIVADGANHRVLVWNQVPLTSPAPAPDRVLGQSSLDRCVRNNNEPNGDVPGRATLSFPADVWSDDTRVVVADAGNNRVLIWRNFPGANLQDADVVLGQSSFTDAARNGGGGTVPTASTLSDPEGVHSDGTALAIADSLNNRVLIWRTFPDNNAQAAQVVLGHLGFDQSATNDGNGDGAPDAPTAEVLNYPMRVLLTPDSLFVTDYSHNRVLRFAR